MANIQDTLITKGNESIEDLLEVFKESKDHKPPTHCNVC